MLSVWSSYDPHKSIHGKSREDSTHLSQEADTAAQQKFGDAADSGQLDLLDDPVAEDAVDNDNDNAPALPLSKAHAKAHARQVTKRSSG